MAAYKQRRSGPNFTLFQEWGTAEAVRALISLTWWAQWSTGLKKELRPCPSSRQAKHFLGVAVHCAPIPNTLSTKDKATPKMPTTSNAVKSTRQTQASASSGKRASG